MTIYGFFKENELVYVGQTTMPVHKRIQKHFNSAKNKRCLNMLIIRAIIKHGDDKFSWKVLKTCKNKQDLNISEMNFIKKYSPRYNICKGGMNGQGLSDETRKKISEFQKKKILCVDHGICFYSVLDAEYYYKAGKGTIGRVAAGSRKSYRGLKFEFITTTNIPKT